MVVIVATAEAADAVSHDDDEDGFQYLLLYVRYVSVYSRKATNCGCRIAL